MQCSVLCLGRCIAVAGRLCSCMLHRSASLRGRERRGKSSRVSAGFRMAALVWWAGAGGRILSTSRLGLILGDDNGDTVDSYLPGLSWTPVDILKAGWVATARQATPAFLLPWLDVTPLGSGTGGRYVLLGHLLCHQLRVDARLASRRALAYVTHQAFERFRRVPERAHTAVPEVVL